jgi:plasmid stabilization system protein ParE
MAADLVFTPEAEADIADAYGYYEQQRPGLGEEFMRSLDAAIQLILRTPAMYRVIEAPFRRGLLRRFPYAVFYEYDAGVVTIHGVVRTARHPSVWQDRLS